MAAQDDAMVKTMSWKSDHQDGDTLRLRTRMTMQGCAFAGTRGIRAVKITADGGQVWSSATLFPELFPYAWAFWKYTWELYKIEPQGYQRISSTIVYSPDST